MHGARRIAFAALLLASAAAPALALDPARLETIARGITRAQAEQILGPPAADITHHYPVLRYELDYRYGANGKAQLIFDDNDYLEYVEFTPAPSAATFDPAKLDAIALGVSEEQVRKQLGAPDKVKRSGDDIELVYLYPGLKPGDPLRHANLHFYNGGPLAQIMYAPVRPPGTPDFDPAALAGIAPGLPETETRARLGLPYEMDHSTIFDDFTYYYVSAKKDGTGEKRMVAMSFWGPDLSRISDGPDGPGVYHSDFNIAALASLKPGLSQAEVRARLGEPDWHAEDTTETQLSYNYIAPKPLARTATLVFARDGTLTEFTVAKSDAPPGKPDGGVFARLHVGLTRTQVSKLIGKPDAVNGNTLTYAFTVLWDENRTETLTFKDEKLASFSSVEEADYGDGKDTSQAGVKHRHGEPDSERHLPDGSVVFDYRGHLPYGPDGGGGQPLDMTVTFDAAGGPAKTTYSGEGAALLDLPAQ